MVTTITGISSKILAGEIVMYTYCIICTVRIDWLLLILRVYINWKMKYFL